MHLRLTYLTTVLGFLLSLSGQAVAQQPAPPGGEVGSCGPLSTGSRELRLQHYVDVFTGGNEDSEDLRASLGLERVAPGSVVEVVSDEGECSALLARAFHILNEEIVRDSRPATHATTEWVVLRIGPYLVVPMQPGAGEGVTVEGYAQVLVFTASRHEFLGWFLG